MTEGGGDSSTAMVDVLDLAKNAISISGLKDAQVCRAPFILTLICNQFLSKNPPF